MPLEETDFLKLERCAVKSVCEHVKSLKRGFTDVLGELLNRKSTRI